jgi:hypothetical protein
MLITAIVFLLFGSVVRTANIPLTMLTDPKAKCMDGTQAGFYAQPASNATKRNKWVIFLRGGGACDSKKLCAYRQYGESVWVSSKQFPKSYSASAWYLASDYCPINPEFCDWNRVLNPYCTQDLNSGQVTEATNATFGFYFSGHLVFKAILDALDKPPYNLTEATDIVLFGVSSGGMSVFINLDYLKQRYRSARVVGHAFAGFNTYATYYNGSRALKFNFLSDFRESAMPRTYALYNSYVDESCRAAYEARGQSPAACLLSNNSLPYIDAELFVVQALTDRAALTGHDQWNEKYIKEAEERAFMRQLQDNTTAALAPLADISNPKTGLFAVACYTHTGFTNKAPTINNMTYRQAFGNFYFRRTPPEHYKLMDDCGMLCNPTCNPVPT